MAVDDSKFILTPGGYQHIQQQLAMLEEKEKEQRAMIGASLNESQGGDDTGDVAAEYDWRARKEITDKQIAHLRYILDRAEIYEDDNPTRIDVGERVTLWDFEAKEEIQLDVISRAELTSNANVGPGVKDASDDSPVGQALLGKSVGDIVEIAVPDGKVRYAVRKIEPIPM
jgi:transcription elongation factor GreA